MTSVKKALPFKILIADDDDDDIQLTKDCFVDNNLHVSINYVSDGQYLLDMLKVNDEKPEVPDLPNLILLDLNMPRKSGFEALAEIKAHVTLCKIPVIIFTTSKAHKDVEKAYELGANCFVSKPSTLDEWCEKLGHLGRFWIECAKVAV